MLVAESPKASNTAEGPQELLGENLETLTQKNEILTGWMDQIKELHFFSGPYLKRQSELLNSMDNLKNALKSQILTQRRIQTDQRWKREAAAELQDFSWMNLDQKQLKDRIRTRILRERIQLENNHEAILNKIEAQFLDLFKLNKEESPGSNKARAK